jgi:coenzyme F420-reducing hydrogenase delta subunit
VLKTLGKGADGVMIFDVEESHEAELAESLVKRAKEALKEKGVEPERVVFQPMVLPIFKVLPKFITDYTTKVQSMGKIPAEKRKQLLEI